MANRFGSGGDGSAPGSVGSPAGGVAGGASASASSAPLAKAQAELARGEFRQAERRAEKLLDSKVAPAVRGPALLVAADAAYALQSYRVAAVRYREFLSNYKTAPEAARAALALGWAEFRSGDRPGARRSWAAIADEFPPDARAPLGLALAAELAIQVDDLAQAQPLLDRIIVRYPSTPYTGIARLSRSILAVRQQREVDAVRDLDAVVKTGGTPILNERRKLIEAVGAPASNAAPADGTRGRAPALDGSEPLARFATVALDGHDRPSAPYVLHGLVLLAAGTRGWSNELVGALAGRLVADFPTYPPGPPLLTRVAGAAVAAGQWPIARAAYETLFARDPALDGKASVEFAEALRRTGATVEARAQLERAAAAGSKEGPRALLTLAEMNEAAGDRRAALSAYDRLVRDYPRFQRSPQSLLAHARLAEEFGPPERARAALRSVVEQTRGEVAAEAAYRLAQSFSAEKQHAAAVEWDLTAARLADSSRLARLALLHAGNSYMALQRVKEALAVYQKLLPLPGSSPQQPEDRETGGEAAYRVAEIFRGTGRHEDALPMYLTAAQLTTGSPTERRALAGAVQCMVATGDRKSAEVTYQRLLQSTGAEPETLAAARNALRTNPGPAPKEWREVQESVTEKPRR